MVGKNNHYLRDTKDGTKVESYSIKKFKVGAASVVIGASIFFGAGAVAQASEEVSNNTTADNTTNAGDKENVPTTLVATAQPVAKETTKEDVAAGLAARLGGEAKALDKTKLENYIAEIEAKLADGAYANKTEESVAVLKEELKAAKDTLENATTQDEITKAYSKLVTTANTKLKAKPVEKKVTPAVDTTNGKETVGKKAENTEKKSESNSIENTGSNDPRNGQAIPKGSQFRAAIAYAEDVEKSRYGNEDSYITSGVKDSSESAVAKDVASRIMKYKTKFNTDATGKITSVDWMLYFNDYVENFELAGYGMRGKVSRNYIQIPKEVNMPTEIKRLHYIAATKFGRPQNLEGADGLASVVTFDNPQPPKVGNAPLVKNGIDTFSSDSWESTTSGRGYDTLYENTSTYFKDAASRVPETKALIDANAIPGKRVIYDQSNTGENARDAYVWEFRTTVPEETTNEQLKNMKAVMGSFRVGTAGIDHGVHTIAANPVNLSKADVTPPKAQDQTVKAGQTPDPKKSIENFNDLPQGTTVKYKETVDTQNPGEQQVTAVVTYPDTSTKEVPVKVIVEKEAVAPAKPVINTDLTGKAGTKDPVEVTADSGATVELFDKDNNNIGEAVAGENGKATITPKVNIPAGNVTATATKNGKTSEVSDVKVATEADTEKPKVSIDYDDAASKTFWVTPTEETNITGRIKITDNSGKIVKGWMQKMGNGTETNIGYGLNNSNIDGETPATADQPATLSVTGTLDKLHPNGKPWVDGSTVVSRKVRAKDASNNEIDNEGASDPEYQVFFKVRSQNVKYTEDLANKANNFDKVVVADPAQLQQPELDKIKAELQAGDGNNLNGKIDTVTQKGDKVVITYNDGTTAERPVTDFARTNNAPTLDIPYSNKTEKQIYLYTTEESDISLKVKDDSGKVKEAVLKFPGGQNESYMTGGNKDAMYLKQEGMTTSEVTASEEAPHEIKLTGAIPKGVWGLNSNTGMTRILYAKDTDDKGTSDSFANNKSVNGYIRFIQKDQTVKYDIKTPAEADKVTVSDVNKVTDAEFDKIKEKVKVEYSQTNNDERLADKKGQEVEDASKVVDKVEKEGNNVVVTYKDGSKDTKPLSEFVTRDTTAPAKPVVETDLTGKAGTKDPVEVTAEPGSTVKLLDKDGNEIGKAVAGDNGKATITPTKDIPAGNVTATATDPAGNTSDASEPKVATDTTAPAKPVVETDLTGKAGTKDPVEVTAEPGSTVKLLDKDGNEIGKAVAGDNGKATITPTKDIPAGNVTATATDPAGNTSDASEPKVATDTTAPAKPVVETDLTGKAGTKDPVEVTAEPGSTVKLLDKDGNEIGKAVAGDNGKATITPTKDIPAGNVTATATDPAGNTSDASEPKVATDTTAPAKPVVETDLTGKAGTKDPVEVTAEPGSTVKLLDKDGNEIGKAVAGDNGKATITPTKDIPAGNVTATATDPAGNTSDASEPKVATDTTAPAKPVVETDLTGKAGTKDPVEVTAEPGSSVKLLDKDGNEIGKAVAGDNGKATITPTKDIPAGNVTATATDPAGNTSDASEPKVATDTTAPAKPVVETDLTGKAGTKDPVEVTAEPGSTVKLLDKDGNEIGKAVAGDNGKATITPTKDIPAGNVTATATDPAGNTSDASEPKVATDTTAPAKPVVETDLTGKAGTKDPVEVTAEPGSTVKLLDKDGNEIGKAVAGDNGKATITPTKDIPAGNVTATATDPAGNTSDASEPKVATDTTAPAKPVVETDLTGKAGTKDPVEVTAEPGSTVKLLDKDGNEIGKAVAGDNGKATITPTKDIPAGNVTATATDPAGNTSDASEPKVATDTTAPAKPVVETDLTGKAGTKDPVEVTAEPGSTVKLLDKDGNEIGKAVAGDNGKATITPTKDIPAGNVTATATDPAGNTSDASEPKVATDTTAPAKPVVETDLTGKAGTKDPVEVTAEPGSTVKLLDKDGNEIGKAVAGDNGKATITPTKDIPAGNVTATATDPAGNTSDASEPKVATDTTAPAKPVVETDLTGKAGTKDPVEVTAEPGSTVKLLDKDGNEIGKAVAGDNGKATITPTKDIPAGNVTATATDPAGNTSDASEPKVATDTTAPAKPVVETDLTGKAGTKDPVEVTAEPGSTVKLLDKDGNEIGKAVAGDNGKATITPTKDIPAGNVTATATDPAGNTSDASEPKVATDTTAPAKPVVETDLTGKAGTKDPVEVTAEPGSTVKLLDKDGNEIGKAVAGDNGKATITPTKDIPAGNVTATATDPAGNTSDASEPKVATDTTAPAKPVVETDLTGKAGTKDPVEVTAEPGSKVELFDKDGNKVGEGVANDKGVATITPTKELPEGGVTAKATDPAGNVSEASEPKEATPAKDTTAPAKPVVTTDLTGKAGTKDPVEVTAEPGSKVELFDKDGNKVGEGVANDKGVATITPTKELPEGGVTAKATDPAGNVSEASEPKEATPAKDTTAPAKPVVTTDLTGKAGTKDPVEVTAEPGSKVELFDKDGNKVGEGVANDKGVATITPTKELPEGGVTAKATDPAGNVSEASEPKEATPAKDTTAPAKPVVETDLTGKAGTKDPVEVTAEPGSTVKLLDKDGNEIGKAVAGDNGKATITPTKDIPAGNVTATATDPAGNVSEASEPKEATPAKDTTAPAKPVVTTDLTGKAGTKDPVEVTAEPGSKVELFDKDGNKVGEGVANDKGVATITPTKELPEGGVTAKATDPAGNVSEASEPKEATPAKDTTAPAKPVVTTDLTGKAGTKDPVEVTAEPGSKVELFDKDGNKVGEGVANDKGVATITPTKELPEGGVTAKATDPAGNVSEASEPKEATPAKDTTAPAKPVVTTDLTGKAGTKDPVEVTAEPGSKVELFDKDGNKVGEGVANDKGVATITPTKELPEGGVTAKATDPAGNVSEASEPKEATPAKDTTAPAKPVVETDLTGKAGTKDPVEVTAEPGSTVKLLDKDGNEIGKAVAGDNGKATITPTKDIPAGNVTATATDPAGNVSEASEPKEATPAKDTTAPAKPVVTTDLTGKAGTKDPVEVTAEPGSKVELFDKDGNKVGEGVANDKGVATITPTKELPEGGVTAKATDPAGNVSEASEPKEATPAKDTTAPAKPVVTTDLTGKAGTKDPVEVTAEPGSKVELFDKDGNKVGEGVANDKGVATITPTKELPEGGVTAKATDPAGNVSEASEPKEATPAKDAEGVKDPEAKTPVKDPANLTDAEKAKVAEEVKKANPTAKDVEVGKDGTATVTFPDGSTAEIPAAKAVEKAKDATPAKDAEGVKDPEAKTPVKDPANLTDAEKAKVAEEVKKANPTAKDVEVGKDGTATVTFPDGSTAEIPAAKAVEKAKDATPAKDAEGVKDPEAKTPVKDPANLTDAEKAKVAEEVKKANPTAKDVEVGKDGTATVTFPDGSTAEIPAAKAVEKAKDATPAKDAEGVKDPEAKTPVKDPANLTDAEKAKVAEEVKKANPTAKDVEVGKDGTATVTFPDGSTAEIPAAKAVEKAKDATPAKDAEGVKDPEAKTPVKDPANLTDAEKAKVAEEVKKANPTAKDVEVGKDGTATVTFPDGSTAEIPAAKAVEKAKDATPAKDAEGVKDPEAKTPVKDPANLTDAEKAKVAEEVKKANPTAKDVEVGKDGTATVTFPDGSTAEIPAAKAVEKAKDATPAKDAEGVKDPEAKTPVKDPANLTDAEKAKVAEEVKKANPTAKDVEVGKDGTATVTFPDGSTAEIPAAKAVEKAKDATPAKDAEGVKDPEAKTPVKDPANLTDAEKAKVAEEVKKANPTAKDVEVGKDGTATVTFPDGSTAEIPAAKAVEKAKDATPAKDAEGVKDPEAKTPVKDPANLTDAEKAKVAEEVKKANPTAKDVEVGKDGTATVTFPDGSTAEIPAAKAVEKAKDATPAKDAEGVKDPEAKTPVKDPANLTDAEKAKVAEEVKKANPTAKDVEVGKDGTATVTFPDGSTAEIPAAKAVEKAKDATPAKDAEGVKDPEAKTPVKDPANLTDAEKAKVAEEVKKANPTAKDVEVGKDGTATVTFPDGSTAEIPAAKAVEKAKDATPAKDAEGVKDPEAKTPVKDPANLTDAEKAKVAEEVKKANPTAKDVEVGKDGTATVTFPDGSTAEIPAAKAVEKAKDATPAKDAEGVKDPEAKTPVKDPANLTDAEKAKVAEEVKKANPTAKDVEVGKDGTATVTFPDGSTAEIPAAKAVEKAKDATPAKDAEGVKDPEAKTPVKDPANLTDAEKAKVAEEVKKANPTAKDVEVGKDGTATVTFPDGSTAEIPAAKAVEKAKDATPAKDAEGVKDPEAKTPVKDPANLTDAEKAKVAEEVKKANPTAKDVEVGKDGTATVTFPDGSTAKVPAAKAVEKAKDATPAKDAEGVKDPEAKTPVKDPANLTDAEKAKVAEEVKKANPTAKDVEVGKDGTATVTFPDGSTAKVPATKAVEKAKDAEGVKDPEAKTPVKDPANLTDAEKAKVAEEVKKSNPTAKDVEVGKDGTATVTFPDGSTAEIPAAKAVEKAKDATPAKDAEGVKDPEAKTPVKDPANLTDAEKAKVAEEVKKANPTAKDVEVGKDGTATVTFPDGSTAKVPAAKAVEKAKDATPAKDAEGVKDPEAKTPVKDPANLTDAEKAKVAEEVKKANPTAKDVEVGKDGTATVTFPDGSTAKVPATKAVEKAKDAEGVKDPEAKTPVKDPANLTDAEKAKVAEEVKKSNPTAKDVEVGKDGTATVTFPDGSTAKVPATKAVEKAKDAEGVKDPEAKTPVKDPANLTDAEKAKVAEEVKKSNPTAKDVEVGKDGTATVTFPDGSTAKVPATKAVEKAKDAEGVKDPEAKTPVKDPANLTDAEKAKVAEEVKKSNPTAKDVEVGKDGTATVTFPDGSTAKVPATKAVEKAKDAEGVKDPEAKTPVKDPANLTDAEKAKVAEEVKKANPTATGVEVGKDGTATVTFPDGSTAKVPATKAVEKAKDATPAKDAEGVKDPEAKTPVKDPANLTDAEKAKVAEEVKKANPTATGVEVGKDGTATVTFADGSTVVIPGSDLVEAKAANNGSNASNGNAGTDVANGNSNAQDTNAKLGQRLANTGTTETNTGLAGLGLGILGGLLAAVRRRKNDKN